MNTLRSYLVFPIQRLLNYLHWPTWLMLWSSLVLLRWELIDLMTLDAGSAWRQGLGLGLHSDFSAALIPAVLASVLLALLAVPRTAGFVLFSGALWVATWGNLIYFRHFGMPLDWWVLEFHTGDVADVSSFFIQLSLSWRVGGSLLLALGSWAVFYRREKAYQVRRTNEGSPGGSLRRKIFALGALASGGFWRNRFRGLAVALGLVLGFFVIQQFPRAFHLYGFANPVNAHILQVWYQQNFKANPYSGLDRDAARKFGQRVQGGYFGDPGVVLARYHRFDEADWLNSNLEERAAPASQPDTEERTAASGQATPDGTFDKTTAGKVGAATGGEGDWPLLRRFEPDARQTRAARRELGLPETGPINVVLLMAEALRVWDILDDEIGPEVFPRLRAIFKNNSLLFSQAYTSSIKAGQTVRGSFSTLCSFPPNMAGPATYLAYPTVRIRCLPELMKENGYVTLWFNSHRANSHNKKFFEGNNGIDHFYDKEFFWERGVREKIGEWGLGDNPVLRESLKKILQWADKKQGPVFVQIVTVSSHGPVRAVEGIRFSDEFERATENAPLYRDFLTQFRYTDNALGNFIDGLFASSIGDNTVVFLLGDHANGSIPHRPITPIQRMDLPFRIPIAIVSKNMRKPEVRRAVVNQVDVAPSAALVAGVGGDVTWLGRNLFSAKEGGTPFVYANPTGFFWRTQSMGCYQGQCVDLRGKDPSVDTDLRPLPTPQRLDAFLHQVVEAGGYAIATNRISPRN